MKVVTMGEMMLRLMPRGNRKIEQAECFEAYYGGDESIVAVSLARFGLKSIYISKLPDNPLGWTAANKLREQGVDISAVAWGGERMGLNFYENGASIRPSSVLYDRKHSAMSEAVPDDFDFDLIFHDASWFHIAGITPALSAQAVLLTETAMQYAKKYHATVSVDLNYRSKLWSSQRAKEVMIPLMQYVDVCIGNEEDADKVLGFKPENTDVSGAALDIEGYQTIFKQMKEVFGFSYIASTLRESYSASDNGWSALLYDGTAFYHSPKYNIHLVDRGGGGAAFTAGLIYGLLKGFDLEKNGRFATAASALKQTIIGDFNLATLNDVLALMNGDASGRVRR